MMGDAGRENPRCVAGEVTGGGRGGGCRSSAALVQYGIPVRPGTKAPVTSGWSDYAGRLPTTAELAAWAERYPVPPYNRGVILGSALGVCVLDIESLAGHGIDGQVALRGRTLPLTLCVRTATGGTHLYYQRPPRAEVASIPDLFPGVELRCDRSHVVIPIRDRARGGPAWDLTWLVDAPIAELPAWLLDRFAPSASTSSGRARAPRARSRSPEATGSEDALAHAERLFRILSCGDPRCDCQRPIRAGRGVGLTHCPSHHDRNPSFSVRIEGGRTLVCCQRQPRCPQAQVLAELELLGAWP